MHLFGIRHRGNNERFGFIISEDTENWNLIDEIGFTPTGAVDVTILVEAGVVVTSGDIADGALDLDGLAAGSVITLTNLGYVQGKGGKGGRGGTFGAGLRDGQNGGPAIFGPGEDCELRIENVAGEIGGGGGGGGGGGSGSEWLPVPAEPGAAGGGGGGGGAGGGAGGLGGTTIGVGGDTDGTAGTAGTTGAAAAKGVGGDGGDLVSGGGSASGGDAGDGGELGEDGDPGAPGSGHSGGNTLGGDAGLAGAAIDANDGTITFLSGGTIGVDVLGDIINEG